MDVQRPRQFDIQAPENRGSTNELPIDLAHLRRYTLGDKALEDEVLRLFLAQLPETLAALRAAATERDWKIAAHTLKGSSRAVGAWRIASLAQEAEALRGPEAEGCPDAIAKLEAAASEARTFFHQSNTLG
ncbi:Hpt domain-containing protein [Hyphomicrobium sp. 2TAF46]|uniref:Hpt domain-containing protein n=1 Tax=Hyphomicrobium sp. 2TAF46 TaxID=3233019 RepID=UPI003F8E9D45